MKELVINILLIMFSLITFTGSIGEKDREIRKYILVIFIYSTLLLVIFNKI